LQIISLKDKVNKMNRLPIHPSFIFHTHSLLTSGATMSDPIRIAKGETDLYLLPQMANRHGMIAGATGTGKTISLQVLAEGLSGIGVSVFMADVKGDLSGISQPGKDNPKIQERVQLLKIKDFSFRGYPVIYWDVFGEQGHPIRATISEMGPLLLARLFDLNDTQSAVLSLVFKIADDNGLLLLDLKDLRAMLQYVGDNAAQFQTAYGNISSASVGAVQRSLLTLGQQSGDKFFGEPALNLEDMIQVDSKGRGTINILAANQLMLTPKTYATFLLWLLSELFERLPEVGDAEKPKLAFFFDEAHLLFNDTPKALLEKIEQVVRLIRSKAVGVYFISQNPLDIPEMVLGQLSNRVQHALRAFTPLDQKAVISAAQTFRSNSKLDVAQVITELGVGEALVSLLDEKGMPGIVQRAFILPPTSQIGPIAPEIRQQIIKNSPVYGRYEQVIDRESAYEKLQRRTTTSSPIAMSQPEEAPQAKSAGSRKSSKPEPTALDQALKAVNSPAGRQIQRELVRGLMGSLLGTSRRR
jgi:DNA helicase HerA-like ATPase